MFDADDIGVFINGLILDVSDFSFENVDQSPLDFSCLGESNQVGSTRYVKSVGPNSELTRPPGKFKDFIKRIAEDAQPQKSIDGKRKLLSSASCARVAKQQKQKEQFVKDDEPEDELDLNSEEVKEAIKQLNNFFKEDNLLQLGKVLDEARDLDELGVGLGIHLMSKLAGKACTNVEKSKYKCPCGCEQNLNSQDKMCIGSEATWHGELDILTGDRTGGGSVAVTMFTDLGLVSSETEYVEREDGQDERSQIINQVMSRAVVFAYTEYNRHSDEGHYIPSIMIDDRSFRFVLYNPVGDMLVVSRLHQYKKKELKPIYIFRPILVLWMVLNHRIFLAKSPNTQGYLKSGFHEKMLNIQDYQNLEDYSKEIVGKSNYEWNEGEDDSRNTIDLKTCEWFFKKFGGDVKS